MRADRGTVVQPRVAVNYSGVAGRGHLAGGHQLQVLIAGKAELSDYMAGWCS